MFGLWHWFRGNAELINVFVLNAGHIQGGAYLSTGNWYIWKCLNQCAKYHTSAHQKSIQFTQHWELSRQTIQTQICRKHAGDYLAIIYLYFFVCLILMWSLLNLVMWWKGWLPNAFITLDTRSSSLSQGLIPRQGHFVTGVKSCPWGRSGANGK